MRSRNHRMRPERWHQRCYQQQPPCKRQELAIGRNLRQMGNTEARNIPHASKQLNKTSVAESEGNDNVRSLDTSGVHVDTGQDESGQGESRETQRRRVGELAVLVGPPSTGLEGTTKGLGVLADGHLAEVSMLAVAEVAVARGLGVDGLLDTVGLLLIRSDVELVSHCGCCRIN
jgi:hypothetical protein